MTQYSQNSSAMDRFVADIHQRMNALVGTVDRDMYVFNSAMNEQRESLRQLDRKMADTGLSMKAYSRSLAKADAYLERTGLLARKLEQLMDEHAH